MVARKDAGSHRHKAEGRWSERPTGQLQAQPGGCLSKSWVAEGFSKHQEKKTASCRASIFDARLTNQTLLQATHATYAPGAHLSSLGVALAIGFRQSRGCRGYGGHEHRIPATALPATADPYRLFASDRGRSPHKLAVISSSPPRRPARTPNLVI